MSNSHKIIIKELNSLISGKCISEIINLEKDNIFNKSAVSVIIKRFIDINCHYNLDEIKSSNISLKFIPVNSEYLCFEAMSFPNTSLRNILYEEWDSNDVLEVASFKRQLDYFFLFIPIIKEKVLGKYNSYFDWKIGTFSLWKPSKYELELIGKEWNEVKIVLEKGIKVNREKFGRTYRNTNNLPKQSNTEFIHLRPHGKNSQDIDFQYFEFTNGNVEITKQSFWLNKIYINQLLKNYKWKMNLKEE